MIIIDETNKSRLSHFYEYVQLLNKESNQILFADDFYGDPTCGLIDISNEWAIIAGKNLTLWTYHEGLSETTTFDTHEFGDIEQLRLIDKDNISILIDPWSEYSAIWQLRISNKTIYKISDFLEYKNSSYTYDISW